MKNIFIITLLIVLVNSLYSQDLVVTKKGDSINCKITKVKKDHIYFTFKHKDEVRNTLLPLTDVKIHQFDYYQIRKLENPRVTKAMKITNVFGLQ